MKNLYYCTTEKDLLCKPLAVLWAQAGIESQARCCKFSADIASKAEITR
jgi:hypothetical protein